jgi:hypothetical protein
MKKIRVITCQIIHQEWEYEVEVEDNFDLTSSDSLTQARYLIDKIYDDNIEGRRRRLGNDEVRDEVVVEYNEMKA